MNLIIERNIKRYALAVLVSATTLLGCQTNPIFTTPPSQVGGSMSIGGLSLFKPKENYGYEGELSPREKELREQSKKFDKTVWQGLLIGAVAGTAIGALAGGDAEDAVAGAIIGGSLGALAGMYVANKQKLYSRKEDQLDSMITDVQTSNREAEALIADARAVLAEDKRRLAAVQARVRKGQINAAELVRERGRAESNRQVIKKAALGARDQYQMFDGAKKNFTKSNPGTSTSSLDKELGSFRKSIDTLDQVAASMTVA